jgi:hypothetical protein
LREKKKEETSQKGKRHIKKSQQILFDNEKLACVIYYFFLTLLYCDFSHQRRFTKPNLNDGWYGRAGPVGGGVGGVKITQLADSKCSELDLEYAI